METPSTIGSTPRAGGAWLGVLLLSLGLLGHGIAAYLNGSGRIAYLHHVGGFFIILAVTGLLIAGAGRLFWRGRNDVTVFVIAIVQAVMGVVIVYLEHGAA